MEQMTEDEKIMLATFAITMPEDMKPNNFWASFKDLGAKSRCMCDLEFNIGLITYYSSTLISVGLDYGKIYNVKDF